ncbi:hypothetical protein ONZ45_g9262 [Pleurotus djamor]|nr:hypothetical protein ONZ45_g9262 [Pleurotus djamor]
MFTRPFFIAAFATISASAFSLHFTRQVRTVQLHPNGQLGKCVTLKGTTASNGVAVALSSCNNSPEQAWEIASGSTKVKLAGSNFCLDAGEAPGNGVQMKVWTCYDNLPAQQWYFTQDRRIALENKGLCLDLPNGNNADGTTLQTWQCTDGNTNQIWTIADPNTSSSSSSSSSSTSSTSSPPTSTPNPSVRLHPNGNNNKCVDVKGDIRANGTPVQIYDCNGSGAQNWSVKKGSTKVQLTGTNFCLDAGTNPASGVGMKIWICYDNLPAQQWYYTNDNRVAVEGKGQCLDLTSGSLNNGNQVQTWQCTDVTCILDLDMSTSLLIGGLTLGVLPLIDAFPLFSIPWQNTASELTRRGSQYPSSYNAIYNIDDPSSISTDSRNTGIALIFFLLFCASLVGLCFYWKILRRWTSTRLQPRSETTPSSTVNSEDSGPGFGFDGLSRYKRNEIRRKDSDTSTTFINARLPIFNLKLPRKPPKLRLSHATPLPPLSISRNQSKARSQESDVVKYGGSLFVVEGGS